MAIFNVLVREVHVSTEEIEANSPEMAIVLVNEGKGEMLICEYSHTLGIDTWSVDLDGQEVISQR